MNEWLWKYPNLPSVPEHYEKEIYEDCQKELIDYFDFNAVLNSKFIINGVETKTTSFLQYDTQEDFKSWVLKNIANSGIANIRAAKSYTKPDDIRDTRGAHADCTRSYVLIYLLESGGENHRTVFYQEKDKPLIRENCYACHDHGLLTEVGSVKIPLRKWILLNSVVLHSVENIPNPRISIQVGLHNIDGVMGLE